MAKATVTAPTLHRVRKTVRVSMDVTEGLHWQYVIAAPEDFMHRIQEAAALAKVGVMQMVFLPGQEADAERWLAARNAGFGNLASLVLHDTSAQLANANTPAA